MLAVTLVQVDHRDDAKLLRFLLKGLHRRTVERLGQIAKARIGRPLRIEPLEGELGEACQLGAVARGGLERRESARDVCVLVFGGVLLDEGDFHGAWGLRA